MARTALNIEGMTCNHCVQAVTKALQQVEGVSSAEVSLEKKEAVVEHTGADLSAMITAVGAEGYEANAK